MHEYLSPQIPEVRAAELFSRKHLKIKRIRQKKRNLIYFT